MAKKIKNHSKKILSLLLAISTVGIFVYREYANAAALTVLSDTMSRVKTGELSNHDIKFRTSIGMSSSTITIDLGTSGGFAKEPGLDYTDIDLQYGSSQSEVNDACSSGCTKATLAATAGAGAWGAAMDSSSDLTLTYPTSAGTAIATNDYVRVLIGTNATTDTTGDKQMTNPSTGTKTFTVNVAGTTDTGKIAVSIIANEQVVVSTTIDPYLSFTVNQNTISLTKSGGGNPDYSNTGYNNGTANTIAANTNGISGYTLSYNGATLTRVGGSETIDAIAAKTTSSTNTEQFGINLKDNTTPDTGANPSGGNGAPASDYNTADNYRYIANTTTPLASASAPTVSTTYTVSYILNVNQTTEAGNYSTAITYICTGNF